jgi:toxin-antitoxin system PIN domain toxin
VNCLLALLDRNHPAHDLVSAWFDRNIEQGWASCPLTQNGYLRIRSQRSYPRPLTLTQAYEQLLAATSTQYHQFIADDISLLDDSRVRYRDLSSYRQLTDVYLLALTVAHDARLVTLDTHIPSDAVRAANESHLVLI